MRLIAHPVLCNYYLTYRCNARCGFCDIWERPSGYVEEKNVMANLKDLKRLGVSVIDFTGGEPLLHRGLSKFLRQAKKLGFITTVTTNAMLYPKHAGKLRNKIDMLHFSLDSAEKKLHDGKRGVACYDFVMESITIAKKLGERPDILFTVFDDNTDQIADVYHEICEPNNLVLILNPVFEYNGMGGQLSTSKLNYLQKWGKEKNVYLNNAFIQLRKDGGNHTDRPVCKAGSSSIVISPENKLVLPCYHLGIKEFSINENLYDLYNSAEVKELVALEGRMPACEGCTINCYMQPSFAVEVNKYWWKALPSTLKYSRMKGTWRQYFAKTKNL